MENKYHADNMDKKIHTKKTVRHHIHRITQHDFFRFLVVGGISTIINYGIFYILLEITQAGYVWASGVGYVVGVGVGYLGNKLWTFGHKERHSISLVSRYLGVYGFTLILGLLFIFLLVDVMHIEPLRAQILTLMFTTVSNYILLKYLVFRT